jgi:hypothetical protein
MKNAVSQGCYSLPTRLLVTTNVVPGSPILVTLMMEALSSYVGSYKSHTA